MSRRVALYVLGSVSVLALAGCGGGWFMEQREPWRHEAEVACLKSGQVKITPSVAQLPAISGPGMCGADFPLKVSSLGDSPLLGFADDPRPPGTIPSFPQSAPRAASPSYGGNQQAPDPYAQPYRTQSYPPQQPYPPSQPQAYPSRYQEPYAQPQGYPAQSAYPAQPGAPMSLKPPGVEQDEDDAAYESSPGYPAQPTYARPGSVTRAPLPASPSPRGAYDPPRAQLPEPYDTPPRAQGNQRYGAPAQNLEPLPPLGPQNPALAGGPATVQPAATLACPMVSALDQWISASVQPAAVRWFGQPVVEVRQISAYSCRGMNGNPRAHISEHAFGNALDISAFTLADGRKVTVKDGWRGLPEERGFLRDVHASACQQFTTVLGPGSNVYHYDHLHVDLMRRSSGRSICNPAAVPGDLVAGRRGGELVTGSIGKQYPALGLTTEETPARGRSLRRAVAGED